MNLSSIIDWMDLLIFVLAILGSIGVVYAGYQLYHEAQVEEATVKPKENKVQQSPPTAEKPQTKVEQKVAPRKMAADDFADQVLEKALNEELNKKKKASPTKAQKKIGYANPSPEKKKKSPFSFFKKEKSSIAEDLGKIMPPKTVAKPKNPESFVAPELIPEQLTLKSPESINLRLKVKGNKLIYRKLRQGDYNELKINYQSSPLASAARKNEYPTGNSLTFSINGEQVTSKTYQFTVFFDDDHGNVYSQQIAGLGREYPIVEKPQKVK